MDDLSKLLAEVQQLRSEQDETKRQLSAILSWQNRFNITGAEGRQNEWAVNASRKTAPATNTPYPWIGDLNNGDGTWSSWLGAVSDFGDPADPLKNFGMSVGTSFEFRAGDTNSWIVTDDDGLLKYTNLAGTSTAEVSPDGMTVYDNLGNYVSLIPGTATWGNPGGDTTVVEPASVRVDSGGGFTEIVPESINMTAGNFVDGTAVVMAADGTQLTIKALIRQQTSGSNVIDALVKGVMCPILATGTVNGSLDCPTKILTGSVTFEGCS